MPYISRITLPNNNSYDIKDATARSDIADIQAVIGSLTGANAVVFRGVSTTALTDGGTQNPTISGTSVTTKRTGDVYFYGTEEFIWGSDSKWHALGSLDTLGSFAYVDTGTVTITPHGSVSKPNITMDRLSSQVQARYVVGPGGNPGTPAEYANAHGGSGGTGGYYTPEGSVSGTLSVSSIKTPGSGAQGYSQFRIYGDNLDDPTDQTYQPSGSVSVTLTQSSNPSTTIKNPTKVTVAKTVAVAAPGSTAPSNNLTYYNYDSTNETLKLYQIGYTTGDSITTSDVSVKKGDATYSVSAASFTGKSAKLYTKIKVSANELPLTGKNVYLMAHGTPTGSLDSAPTFTGTQETWTVNPSS